MAKPPAAELIVLHFDDELAFERLQFAAARGAPATRPARRASRETRLRQQLFQCTRHSVSFACRNVRCESHMVQQTAVVEKSQQQRADELAVCPITKTADDAIGGAHPFVLLHARALARLIGEVD